MISKEKSNITVPYSHFCYQINYCVTASDVNDAHTKLQMAVKVDEVHLREKDEYAVFEVPSIEDIKELRYYSQDSKDYGFIVRLYTTCMTFTLLNGKIQKGCILKVSNMDLDEIVTDFLVDYKVRMEKVYKSLNANAGNVVVSILSYTTTELSDARVVLADRNEMSDYIKDHWYNMQIKVKAEIKEC